MNAHYPSSCCYPTIKHVLHYSSLRGALRKANAVALPIGLGPSRLRGRSDARHLSKHACVAICQFPSPSHNHIQPLELQAAYSSLNIREAVIESDDGILLSHDYGAAVADRIWNAHAMLTPELE